MLVVTDHIEADTFLPPNRKEDNERLIHAQRMDYWAALQLITEAWEDGNIRFCVSTSTLKQGISRRFPVAEINLDLPTVEPGDHLLVIAGEVLDLSAITIYHFTQDPDILKGN